MPTRLYGIPNCDTVKRARAFLAERGAAIEFVDFKKTGVPPERLDHWLRQLGWEALLNRKGTTWRQLDDVLRNGVVDAATAKPLMLAQPSVIKRPVVDWADGSTTVGFDAVVWAARTGDPA
jgi:arsenate reductase (glutaredoxin)